MAKKRPAMTKSPAALAKHALEIAKQALPSYSDLRSRHDFTQSQLFAIMVLRQFFRTDYRGIIQILADSSDLRNILGLNKLPHFTTVQKAQNRMLKKTSLSACLEEFSNS